MFKSLSKGLLTLCLLLAATTSNCFAVMATADETAVLAGISGSDVLYYKIAGAVLVVMAGFWGFKKVRASIS
jgi:hypothetical protein